MNHENNEDSFDIEIELDDKKLKKKKKILSELKELDEVTEVNSSSLFLPSKLLEENKAKKEEKKSKKKGSLKSLTESANDWNDMIVKMKFNNKSHVSDSYDVIEYMFTKKKKKKKKKKKGHIKKIEKE